MYQRRPVAAVVPAGAAWPIALCIGCEVPIDPILACVIPAFAVPAYDGYAGNMIKLSRIAALVVLAIIIFATLSPIQMRPHIAEANVERALAYVLLGFTVALGFPNRLYQAVIFVVATAGVLELLQIIDPSRHARLLDAIVKAFAGVVGIVVGQMLVRRGGRRALR